MMINYLHIKKSPIGHLYITSDGDNITGLWIEYQKYFMAHIDSYLLNNNLIIFKLVDKWLDDYFAGLNPLNNLPIKIKGTKFQMAVWTLLSTIEYGQTVTYKQLSDILRKQNIKSSPQAIGQAVGHNPISIIIPCHRVLGSNGQLKGYAGGLHIKEFLLQLEKKI